MHINLTILSTKDTTLFSDGNNSVSRVVHIYFANSEKIIEIIKSLISAIWSNIQVIIKSKILSHSFATNNLEQETDLCSIHKLLGHDSIKNTRIYTHIIQPTINYRIL